ncbi:Ig-like domain-containing protein [bacterium]|nr:Ig-like domain-containing protein [bacterium]
MQKRSKPLALIILWIFGLSCARIQAPQGGPEDKSPPEIVETNPQSLSLGVSPTENIVICFDEYIKPIKNATILLPRVEGLETKIKGKKLTITHKEPFSPNTTYRVSISSKISDYRNNYLSGSEGFAFSTGQSIDSLDIRGRIYQKNGFSPAGDMRVEAFALEDISPLRIVDNPIAASWVGVDGRFTLNNLPERDYFLRAFRDINGDGQPNDGEELAYAPALCKAGERPAWVMLSEPVDTIPPRLISVLAENEHVLKLRFSEDIELRPSARLIFSSSSKSTDLILGKGSANTAYIFVSEAFDIADNRFKLINIEDLAGNELIPDEMSFEVPVVKSDTLHTKVSYSKEPILPNESLVVKLSKPIDKGIIIVEDSTGAKIPGRTSIEHPYWLVFKPLDRWPLRRDLMWALDSSITIAGEVIEDTIRRRINILDQSQFGALEVRSVVDCENLIISAYSVNDDSAAYRLELSDGFYKADYLPEGSYVLFAFCDANGDSEFSNGQLSPLIFSEEAYISPDTINVRGFWTTEYEFKAISR